MTVTPQLSDAAFTEPRPVGRTRGYDPLLRTDIIRVADMFYSLIRPLLFRLDPEDAHDRALHALTRLAPWPGMAGLVRGVMARPASRTVQRMGLTFSHPVGLAAGFDKNGIAVGGWWALGFAFVELGTVTPRPQTGNPRPRMFRLPAKRALLNRMGFNNDGADAVAARLERLRASGGRPPLPIGISVGKNADTPLERAAEDYAAAAARVAPQADFITMNVSSPNTQGLRGLQSGEAIGRLVAAVRGVIGKMPLLVKLAPELEGDALRAALEAAREAGAEGFIATNTLAVAAEGDRPAGGLSGAPLRETALRRVEEIRRHVGDGVTLIGCGGIDDPAAARAMLSAGADLIQIYSGLVYRGPFLAARLSRALAR